LYAGLKKHSGEPLVDILDLRARFRMRGALLTHPPYVLVKYA
jgi:hypothetical protein